MSHLPEFHIVIICVKSRAPADLGTKLCDVIAFSQIDVLTTTGNISYSSLGFIFLGNC